MSVFRETKIEWRGVDYTLTPSMSLLRAIELQGISLMHVQYQAAAGKPQASLMATIMAICLAHAGASVSEDEIYQEMQSADPAEALKLYRQIMDAISPEEKAQKKDEAPAESE